MKLKLKAITGLLLVLPWTAALADDLPNSPVAKPEATRIGNVVFTPRPVQPVLSPVKENRTGSLLFFESAAACGSLLAASTDRGRAAEFGVPLWLGASLFAHKLHTNHPKISYALQLVSPLGCYASSSRSAKKLSASNPPITPPTIGDPAPPSGSGNPNPPAGSGNPPSTGGGTSGGGSGSGSGGTGTGSGGGSNGGGTGGSGNPPPPPPPPPVTPPTGCIVRASHDCGIGNGGINNGSPKSGPPFTPPGQGGTPGSGSKKP
jgi:uncharacterized membrane protein YgcG